MTGDARLDSLSSALRAHHMHELIFEWTGLSYRGLVHDFMYPDDLGATYGGWVVYVREVLEDSGRTVGGVRPSSGKPSEVSLHDPPVRVTTLNGEVVWEHSR